MIQEPIFELPAVVAPTMQDTVVPAPVVIPPVAIMNDDEEPVLQDPIEPVATHGGRSNSLKQKMCQMWRPLEGLKELEDQQYLMIMRCITLKNFQMEGDPTSFEEAMRSDNSSKWLEAMEDEIKSISTNKVWDLEPIPKGAKTVGCKWVYKTKHDSQGNIERFKARLVAKGFTQREGIDYNETFSLVSCKDSFKIIMTLVAHYNLELHQMDVKMTFLNGDLEENVYMAQPKGFVMEGKEQMGCRLKKSIYGLK
jgi:hypothetical protein